ITLLSLLEPPPSTKSERPSWRMCQYAQVRLSPARLRRGRDRPSRALACNGLPACAEGLHGFLWSPVVQKSGLTVAARWYSTSLVCSRRQVGAVPLTNCGGQRECEHGRSAGGWQFLLSRRRAAAGRTTTRSRKERA